MVHVARLSLSNFRSYADAVIVPGAGLNVLIGENGAGKTNVLEAVSLLAAGRGLSQATVGEMVRSPGAGGCAVAAPHAAAGGRVDGEEERSGGEGGISTGSHRGATDSVIIN